MFPIEQTIENLRFTAWMGVLLIVLAIAAYVLSPLIFGLNVSYYEPTPEAHTQPFFERSEWLPAFGLVMIPTLSFLVGLGLQLLIAGLFIPKSYRVLYPFFILFASASVAITMFYAMSFMYGEFYAINTEQRYQAVVWMGLCFSFYGFFLSLNGFIISWTIYIARTVPRWLISLSWLLTAMSLPGSIIGLNPALPLYRLVLGSPPIAAAGMSFAAYCWILAQAKQAADTEKTTIANQ